MSRLVALVCGLLFGAGLALSDMIDPARVLAFLDVAGRWDPTLAYVMAGAVAVAAPGFWIARRRGRPILGETLHVPASGQIDARLLGGAALFGVGWGLVGFCPGPALAALPIGGTPTLIFVAAMAAGMGGFALAARLRPASASPSPRLEGAQP